MQSLFTDTSEAARVSDGVVGFEIPPMEWGRQAYHTDSTVYG